MAGRTIGHLKKDKRTKKKQQEDFLAAFGDYASVSRAAKKAKVARSNIYEWLKNDDAFKLLYKDALKLALWSLEDEAVRRAHEGVLKPVYQGGKKVGSVREYSDTLLIVLLKARAPGKYKDRVTNEHSGPQGSPIPMETTHKVIFENYGQ